VVSSGPHFDGRKSRSRKEIAFQFKNFPVSVLQKMLAEFPDRRRRPTNSLLEIRPSFCLETPSEKFVGAWRFFFSSGRGLK